MLRPRLRLFLLAIVLLAGLALRLWYATDPAPFPDEKYALRNVASVLETHTLLPANAYYPSPVFFVPAAALVAASNALPGVSAEPIEPVEEGRSFSATDLLLCRVLQVLYGTLSLYLVYLLGRVLFSPRVGLIGAAAVAFMPLHIRASAYFKPDAQLMLTVLAAFLLGLWALRRGRLVGYLIAGAAVALAMSGKLLGALVAVPIAAGILLSPEIGWRRRWTHLAGFAAAAGGLFVLLNPYWRFYPTWLHRLQVDYARRTVDTALTHLQVPVRLVKALLGDLVHGPWIGALALAGLAGLTIVVVRSGVRTPSARDRLLFLSFPFLFTFAYALVTARFKINNFIAIVPFTALAAGWTIERLDRSLFAHRDTRWWHHGRAAAAVLLTAALAIPGVLFTYRSRTPTTSAAALQFLTAGLSPRMGRSLMIETTSLPVVGWGRVGSTARRRVTVHESRDLSQLDRQRLAASDGALFHEARLEESSADLFFDLVRPRAGRRVKTFRPSPFRLRGPALVAVVDRWTHCGRTEALTARWSESEGHYLIDLPPAIDDCDAATISLWVPRSVFTASRVWGRVLRIDGRQVPLRWIAVQRHRHLFSSERLPWPASGASAIGKLRRPWESAASPEVVVSFWRRPSPAASE